MKDKKLTFGANPSMREVPTGQHALISIGKDFSEWKTIDTEWGQKFSFPITLFSHPSYESIPSKGMTMTWESKSVAALNLFAYIYQTDGEIRTFDWDVEAEFKGKWKLHRTDSGTYQLEQL